MALSVVFRERDWSGVGGAVLGTECCVEGKGLVRCGRGCPWL